MQIILSFVYYNGKFGAEQFRFIYRYNIKNISSFDGSNRTQLQALIRVHLTKCSTEHMKYLLQGPASLETI